VILSPSKMWQKTVPVYGKLATLYRFPRFDNQKTTTCFISALQNIKVNDIWTWPLCFTTVNQVMNSPNLFYFVLLAS
jgi:hypothetical protein